MRLAFVAAVALALLGGCASAPPPPPAAPAAAEPEATVAPSARVQAFTGGRWFTGSGFEAKTAWAVDGVLTFTRPSRVDSTVDLAGGYVVSPFGEAHNHNVEHSSRTEETIANYLRDGVFYVKNPNNLPRSREPLEGRINTPTSIDAVFANGGLTGSGGHPALVARRNVDRGSWTAADGSGAFYYEIDSAEDVDRLWDTIVAGRPDFLKTYLVYSEQYLERRDDPAFVGWRGLDPVVLPHIVRRARESRMRVAAHVETGADFHYAAIAGVDEIAHLPGFRGDADVKLPDPTVFEIPQVAARNAGRLGTIVVTTVGGIRELDPAGPDGELRKAFDRLHTRNIKLLLEHGVRLVIGSDDYGDTSVGEAMYLHGLGVMDNLALLKAWSQTTPRSIFPRRNIGCLDEGCEASFLVLGGDPIADFMRVRDIRMRVKQGHTLDIPSRPR